MFLLYVAGGLLRRSWELKIYIKISITGIILLYLKQHKVEDSRENQIVKWMVIYFYFTNILVLMIIIQIYRKTLWWTPDRHIWFLSTAWETHPIVSLSVNWIIIPNTEATEVLFYINTHAFLYMCFIYIFI